MSKPANRNKYWICPFFKWDGAMSISCEGGKIVFPSADTANDYMDRHCAGNPGWKNCSVAAALCEYYEQEDVYEKR